MKSILVGGKALKELGSKRNTDDIDFLIFDSSSKDDFIIDKENNIDYCNANGNKFFNEIYQIEKENKIASPQSLLELKSYAFVHHCVLGHWQKADDCEYDIKFLVRKFNLKSVNIVNKYLKCGELLEIAKIISNVK
jgi:hypothetical protein